MGLRDFLERLVGSAGLDADASAGGDGSTSTSASPPGERRAAERGRTTGPPPSGNGASSFHLFWDAPPVPLTAAEVTIEVIDPPAVAELYFWALQVNFERGGGRVGGAHFGLQYHPAYPGAGAVNWGGYADVGGELDGSVSDLPSALDNINTRTFAWEADRAYRYRVAPAPEQQTDAPAVAWRGSITDLTTGVETVVRDLWVEADHLSGPMVWSEVFADCDGPSAAVRWSDLTVTTAAGERFAVDTVRLNYQTHRDGGCANTDSSVDPTGARPGFVQRTAVPRANASGSRLTLPASPAEGL